MEIKPLSLSEIYRDRLHEIFRKRSYEVYLGTPTEEERAVANGNKLIIQPAILNLGRHED